MATTTDPNASYYASIASGLASSNPNQALEAAEQGTVAPQVAGAALQYAGIENQLGMVTPELAQQNAYQSQMAGFQLGGLGLSQQQTALQQAGAEQQYGFQQQQFGQEQQQNQLNFQNQLQSLVGGQAASGALNTQGSKTQQGTLGQEAAWQQQTLQGQEALSQGDFARAMQNYQIIGEQNNLSAQEVQARLQEASLTGGEGAAQNIDQLVAQAGGVLSGATQDVGGALANYGLAGGVNPTGAYGS